MATTRGKKIEFDLGSSGGELDAIIDVDDAAEPAHKRRKTKKSTSTEADLPFNLGSSSGKGKGKQTPGQDQLITRRGGRGGKLRDLMYMPVDIFTEICSYLGPYDLRRLSLSSKRLWDILMTKEARHIWKTALDSVVDLPECPSDLKEPQYGSLTPGNTDNSMTTEWILTFRRDFDLGINDSTLTKIIRYFDSYLVMSLASNYQRNNSDKNDQRHYYTAALKKAAHEYDAFSSEEARMKYLSLLGERRDYRVKTGEAMVIWKNNQLASRADEIAARKDARYQSIKAKLIALGWEPRDFPMGDKAFKDLVSKDQKLTPKVWKNVKSKLEPMLEKSRNNRLEKERSSRKWNRRMAVSKFYHRMSREILDLPFKDSESPVPRPSEAFFELQPISLLLGNDTETVTQEQWVEVAPDVRSIVVEWWQDALQEMADRLQNSTLAEPYETIIEFRHATGSEMESIEALKTKLSRATSAFRCSLAYCGRVVWFPYIIQHGLSVHKESRSSGLVLPNMEPLQPKGQELVKRLLKDLNIDPETPQWSETEHYLNQQKWFDDVTKAVRYSPTSCYPSRGVNGKLPKIVNDHDWISRR
ncbi:hypothetical protein FRC01_011444 [Tulasnella sp. 417]|nr:hypothetical protein FRC01_011444 [Tulasnella sp. 417]